MKKLSTIVTGLLFMALVSCGPSAADKAAAAAKVTADSIAKADSANALLKQASEAAAMTADTTAVH